MADKLVRYFKVEDDGEFWVYWDGTFVKLGSITPTPGKMQVVESNGYLPVKYVSGDFGGGFASLDLGTPAVPCVVIVEDTNDTTPGVRLYCYTGSEWKYVDLS